MINLSAIAANQERSVLRAFNDVISSIKDTTKLSELTRALEAGNVDAAIDILQLDRATFEPFEDSILRAYRQGGITGANQIGVIPSPSSSVAFPFGGSIQFRFDLSAIAAQQWAARKSSDLVVELIDQQRELVRKVVTEQIATGTNPRTAALDLIGRIDTSTGKRTGGFIGLTDQQEQWIVNARDELRNLDPKFKRRKLRDKRFDSVIEKAIKDGKPLTNKQINNAITRMQARALKFRADSIARTESLNALRAGQFESIRQAVAVGGIDDRDVKKIWDATGDARTRDDHRVMELNYSGGIRLESSFVAPDGSRLLYPGDTSLGATGAQTVQCRCIAKYKIDFIGRVVRMEGF